MTSPGAVTIAISPSCHSTVAAARNAEATVEWHEGDIAIVLTSVRFTA